MFFHFFLQQSYEGRVSKSILQMSRWRAHTCLPRVPCWGQAADIIAFQLGPQSQAPLARLSASDQTELSVSLETMNSLFPFFLTVLLPFRFLRVISGPREAWKLLQNSRGAFMALLSCCSGFLSRRVTSLQLPFLEQEKYITFLKLWAHEKVIICT